MRTVLIYNPVAGNNRARRKDQIAQICVILSESGFFAEAMATTSTGSAKDQARAAATEGADYIFACGGDGTVHDVLQGIVDETNVFPKQIVLGIIPMGSANALARHLGLSMSPIEAVRQQMKFVARAIPIGKIECRGNHRYFTVMAGAGPDGALVYKMLTDSKGRMGRLAYYTRAAKIFASSRFPSFDLTCVQSGSGQTQTMQVVGTIAVRISDLRGLFSRLAGTAEPHHPHLRLIAIRPPAWLSLPSWFGMAWLGLERWNPLVRVVDVNEFTCTPVDLRHIHVQADGEWIGPAPMRVTLVNSSIRLLMPTIKLSRHEAPNEE